MASHHEKMAATNLRRGSYVNTTSFQKQLSQQRDVLDQERTVTDVSKDIHAFRFLWQDYQPRYYLWEVYESLRRVFFTAALAVIRPGSNLQLTVGVAGAIVSAAIYTVARPFLCRIRTK